MGMPEDEGDAGGIPEWVVTFGDMMSLLLTFFIMLVSLSEVVADQKYRAILDALQQYLGYRTAPASPELTLEERIAAFVLEDGARRMGKLVTHIRSEAGLKDLSGDPMGRMMVAQTASRAARDENAPEGFRKAVAADCSIVRRRFAIASRPPWRAVTNRFSPSR